MFHSSTAADMASKRSNTPANISPPLPPNPDSNLTPKANQTPSQNSQTDPKQQVPSTPHNHKNSKPKERKQLKFKTLGEKFLYCQKLVEDEKRAKNTVDLTKDGEEYKAQNYEKEKGDNEERSIEAQIDLSSGKTNLVILTKQTSTEEESKEVTPLEMIQLVAEKEIRDEYTGKRLAFETEMELSKEDSTKSDPGKKKFLYSTPDLQKLTTTLTNDLYTTTPHTIPPLLQSLHTLRNKIPKPQHPLLSQQILLSINKKLLDGYWKASLMTSIDNYVSHIANNRPDIGKSGFWDDCPVRVKRPEGRFCGLGGCKEKVMVLAMGICVLVAPWVIRDLGFVGWLGWYWEVAGEGEEGKEERELGCVDFVENGSFAAQWFQRCNGEISKAMLYSYFLELGMVWD